MITKPNPKKIKTSQPKDYVRKMDEWILQLQGLVEKITGKCKTQMCNFRKQDHNKSLNRNNQMVKRNLPTRTKL